MRLMSMAVDSGGEDGVTDNAYKFWRKCRREGLGKRVYLFKGDSVRRSKLIQRTFPITPADQRAAHRRLVMCLFIFSRPMP
jgi:phage terminase large subunit GpA-like protein